MRTLPLIVLLLSVTSAAAQGVPAIGEVLPELLIEDKGEVAVIDDELHFQPWSSAALRGHWTLLQYLAARPSADKLNRWALDEISGRADNGHLREFKLYNIINVDDVSFGATGFALGAIKSNKKKHPEAPMVADMGHGRAHWGLTPRSSAIFVLDPDSRVRFFRDGALSQADVQRIVSLLTPPAD